MSSRSPSEPLRPKGGRRRRIGWLRLVCIVAGVGTLAGFHSGCEPAAAPGSDRPPGGVELRSDDRAALLASLGALGPGELDRAERELERLPRRETELRELMARWRTLHPTAPLPHIRLVSHSPPSEPAPHREDEIPVSVTVPDLPSEVIRQLVLATLPAPRVLPLGLPLPTRSPTLLEEALREGTADFLTQMVTGRSPAPELHRWAGQREAELWDDFRRVMGRRGVEWTPELGPEADTPPSGRPGAPDPVRYVGFRIVESFWNRSPDRRQALDELLEMDDAEDILDRASYGGQGAAAPATTRGLGLDTWPGFVCDRMRVGEPRLQLCVAGEGPMTVVLESGDELNHRTWGGIIQEVAALTRVAAYDRAGTGDSEPGPEPRTLARAAHERAGAAEMAGGTGPYIFVVPPSLEPELDAFEALYPWRVGARIVLPMEDPRSDPYLPAWLVEEVTRELARLAGAGGDVQAAPPSPPVRGEPVGCWAPAIRPAPAGREAPPRLRLALTPRGGDPHTGDGHAVLDVTGVHSRVGTWHPLDEETVQLELELRSTGSGSAPGGALQATLERAPGGGWRGPARSLESGPTGAMAPDWTGELILTGRPCEVGE